MKKETLRNFLRSLNERIENYDEKLKQNKQILPELFDSTEKFGEKHPCISTGYAFDKLRWYKTQILTKENKKYAASLYVNQENMRFLKISDYEIETGWERTALIKEISRDTKGIFKYFKKISSDETYVFAKTQKLGKIGINKYLDLPEELTTMSSKELCKFLDDVYGAKHNFQLTEEATHRLILLPLFPKKNKN
jgi:hypothetical protein